MAPDRLKKKPIRTLLFRRVTQVSSRGKNMGARCPDSRTWGVPNPDVDQRYSRSLLRICLYRAKACRSSSNPSTVRSFEPR
jgi:hypothetical protein